MKSASRSEPAPISAPVPDQSEHTPDLQSESGDGITVHYNGACPICRPEVEHYRRSVERDAVIGVGFEDITDPARKAQLAETLAAHGITMEQAARRFTVIAEDGSAHTGTAGFIILWSRLPKFRWLAKLVGAPVIRPCAEFVYDRILAPLLYWSNKRAGRLDGLGS